MAAERGQLGRKARGGCETPKFVHGTHSSSLYDVDGNNIVARTHAAPAPDAHTYTQAHTACMDLACVTFDSTNAQRYGLQRTQLTDQKYGAHQDELHAISDARQKWYSPSSTRVSSFALSASSPSERCAHTLLCARGAGLATGQRVPSSLSLTMPSRRGTGRVGSRSSDPHCVATAHPPP